MSEDASTEFNPLDADAASTEPSLTDDFFADDDDAQDYQRRGLKWLLILVLLLGSGAGGAIAYRRWQSPPQAAVAVSTVPVERGPLEDVISAEGTVELGGQKTLKAPDDVTIQSVLVEEGQQVPQGTVLLEFRNRDIEEQLANQLIDNQIAELDLQRSQEQLQQQEKLLQQAQDRLADARDLLAQEYISESDFQDEQNRVDQAQSSLRDAQLAVQKNRLQIQQNRTRTANLQAKLRDVQIVAPFDAVVLAIAVKAGDGVPVEKDLMVIGDPSQEKITFSLPTLDAPKVRPGQPVRVGVIGPNQEEYPGRVAWISPQATTGSDNSSSGQATVNAEAVLNRPSGALIPGSSVRLDIILQQRQNALTVPLSAIQNSGDSPFVWVKDAEGTAQKREIEVGLSTDQAAEVLSGLEEGDQIIPTLPPDVELTPGMPLTDAAEAGPPDASPLE